MICKDLYVHCILVFPFLTSIRAFLEKCFWFSLFWTTNQLANLDRESKVFRKWLYSLTNKERLGSAHKQPSFVYMNYKVHLACCSIWTLLEMQCKLVFIDATFLLCLTDGAKPLWWPRPNKGNINPPQS